MAVQGEGTCRSASRQQRAAEELSGGMLRFHADSGPRGAQCRRAESRTDNHALRHPVAIIRYAVFERRGILLRKPESSCALLCIVILFVSVVRGFRVAVVLHEGLAELIPVGEGKVQIIRPAGVPGDDHNTVVSCPDILFQLSQRLNRQLVILGQGADKAIAAVRSKPDGVAGEQVGVVDQIDQMSPGVAGDQNALDLDIADRENLPVLQQHLPVVGLHHRQLI